MRRRLARIMWVRIMGVRIMEIRRCFWRVKRIWELGGALKCNIRGIILMKNKLTTTMLIPQRIKTVTIKTFHQNKIKPNNLRSILILKFYQTFKNSNE